MKYFSILFLIKFIFCTGFQYSHIYNSNSENPIYTNLHKSDTIIIKINFEDLGRFYYLDDFENINILDSIDNKILPRHSYLQLIDGKSKISFFLKKGENIHIVNRGGYSLLESEDSVRTIELRYSFEEFMKFDLNFQNIENYQRAMLEDIYINNSSQRDSIFRIGHSLEIDFLKSYQKEHNLSYEFYKLHYSILKYKYLERNLMAGYFDFQEKYISMISKNARNELNKDENLFLESYRNSLMFFFDNIHKKSPSKSSVKLINDNFHKKSKNYLLAMLIMSTKKNPIKYNIKNDELEVLINEYVQNCKFPEDCDYLVKKSRIEKLALKDDEVININIEPKSLLNINNSQITYIDFWASWCGPCIAEMPYSKKLKEEYKKKGINFIFISIDENYTAWKSAMIKLGLSTDESYLLPNVNKSQLAKNLNIETIPRYIIIDKKGRVINQDSPRPSDPKIKNIFNELLNIQ